MRTEQTLPPLPPLCAAAIGSTGAWRRHAGAQHTLPNLRVTSITIMALTALAAGHTDSVLSCTVLPGPKLLASGGEASLVVPDTRGHMHALSVAAAAAAAAAAASRCPCAIAHCC